MEASSWREGLNLGGEGGAWLWFLGERLEGKEEGSSVPPQRWKVLPVSVREHWLCAALRVLSSQWRPDVWGGCYIMCLGSHS